MTIEPSLNSKRLVVVNITGSWLLSSLYWRLRGADVVVIDVGREKSRLRSIQLSVSRWVARTGLILRLTDLFPELIRYQQGAGPEYERDIFRKIETWMEETFYFEKTDKALGEYAYTYRHITCNQIQRRMILPVLIEEIVRRSPRKIWRFTGFGPVVTGMAQEFCDVELPPFSRRLTLPNSLSNLVVAAGILSVTIAGILRRISIFPLKSKSILLAVDYIADRRDYHLYEVVQAIGDVLLVPRSVALDAAGTLKGDGIQSASLKSGKFSLLLALLTLRMAVRHSWQIYIHCRRLRSDHYAEVAKMVYKRMIYRAFFKRYAPSAFWCRDDYNPDHIVRSQELRRIGGRSIGLNHGFPIMAEVVPQYRYIDYDDYLTFGLHLYQKHYKDTWPSHMRVHGAGCFAMTRSQIDQRSAARPNDIAVFLKIGFWPLDSEPKLTRLVTDIAAAFPDRRIIVKFKSLLRSAEATEKYKRDWVSRHSNIEIAPIEQDPYELMLKVSFLVSDPSSIVAEAINFGVKSFVLDMENWESLVFRDYPDLCVRDCPEFIQRVRDIEAGLVDYPFDQFSGLIAPQDQTLSERLYSELQIYT